jgi:hypothetical protein
MSDISASPGEHLGDAGGEGHAQEDAQRLKFDQRTRATFKATWAGEDSRFRPSPPSSARQRSSCGAAHGRSPESPVSSCVLAYLEMLTWLMIAFGWVVNIY